MSFLIPELRSRMMLGHVIIFATVTTTKCYHHHYSRRTRSRSSSLPVVLADWCGSLHCQVSLSFGSHLLILQTFWPRNTIMALQATLRRGLTGSRYALPSHGVLGTAPSSSFAKRWQSDAAGDVIGIDLGTTNSCVAIMVRKIIFGYYARRDSP